MKKAIGQTVRDLKRGVNKKVLKVPVIEQKVLDATSNESWGPHGSLLADIAQASRNYHECQMIMGVIWKRINDTGKNWRHVYKALTVLEYLVANGSERVIEEIREHGHQISTLSNFQYVDSSGRDQGNNIRKKSQSLVLLVNDKQRIIEVRQQAAANRDKFHNNSAGGMYRPGSYSSSGTYGDDSYGNREEDRGGYGFGKDYEEQYSRDGNRDDEHRGRSQTVDDYHYGSRSRSSDKDHDYDDDGQRSSRAKAEDHSLEGRLEPKISEQNMGAPPSYEETVSQRPLHNERDGEISEASAPRDSFTVSGNPYQTSAPVGSSLAKDNPTEETAAVGIATSGNLEVESSDEFDPRGPVSAALAPANNVEMDLFGSLPESFSSNALALVPSAPATTTPQSNTNFDSTTSFTPPPSASTNDFNPLFEDPFGDSPFQAIPSTATAPPQLQMHQSPVPSQSSGLTMETIPNFGFGDSFSSAPHSTPGATDTQPLSTNSQVLPQDLSTPQEPDILADILPFAPLPGTTLQQNYSAPPDAQSLPSLSASSGQITSQSFLVQTGQVMQQAFSAPGDQQPPFSVSTSHFAQQPFPAHAGQPAWSDSHLYGGFHSHTGSLTAGAPSMFPQSQSGYNRPTNGGNFQPRGSAAHIPSYMVPQAPTEQLQQSGNYFPQHGGSAAHFGSQFPKDQASHFNNGNFTAQKGNADPFTHQLVGVPGGKQSDVAGSSLLGQGVNAPHASQYCQPSKDKFETKSTVWADTLNRGLVNLNISGPKINPLADIGIDFDAINRKEKRMEKPTTTSVTSTVTMGKAMGSGSGIGRAGAGALRPPSNLMMGMGTPGVGMGMGDYGGINVPGMGMGQGVQMQPHIGLPPGSNVPGNYNSMTGRGGYPQQPYYGGGGYR